MSTILFILIILGVFGFLQVPLFAFSVFVLGNTVITLNDVLLFFVMMWLIGMLPYPFREIASVLFLLWILGSLGIIAIAGFSNIVLIAFIVGLVAFLAQGRYTGNS